MTKNDNKNLFTPLDVRRERCPLVGTKHLVRRAVVLPELLKNRIFYKPIRFKRTGIFALYSANVSLKVKDIVNVNE